MFYIVESKYSGTAKLKPTVNSGPQMSDQWINSPLQGNTTTRLQDAVGGIKAQEIEVKGYQRILSEVEPNGNITYKSINSDGSLGGVINL